MNRFPEDPKAPAIKTQRLNYEKTDNCHFTVTHSDDFIIGWIGLVGNGYYYFYPDNSLFKYSEDVLEEISRKVRQLNDPIREEFMRRIK